MFADGATWHAPASRLRREISLKQLFYSISIGFQPTEQRYVLFFLRESLKVGFRTHDERILARQREATAAASATCPSVTLFLKKAILKDEDFQDMNDWFWELSSVRVSEWMGEWMSELVSEWVNIQVVFVLISEWIIEWNDRLIIEWASEWRYRLVFGLISELFLEWNDWLLIEW